MERDITLTDREQTVIDCIKRGLITSEEIAEELHIAKCYADTVICRLFVKYDINAKNQPRARLVWVITKQILQIILEFCCLFEPKIAVKKIITLVEGILECAR